MHEITPQTHSMPCVRFDLSSSDGMSLHTPLCAGVLCTLRTAVCPGSVRFGPGHVYCHQTCLILGKYFKCVITGIGSRLLSCAVQMIDMLIEED